MTRKGKRIVAAALCGGIVFAAGIAAAAALWPGKPAAKRTVADAVRIHGPDAKRRLLPYFRRAGLAYPPHELTFLAMKQEMRLEVWARNGGPFRLLRTYSIRAASGRPGPKLREGDRQVPEGLYQVVGLNPNSRYHLSLELNFPNDFDLEHARREGRTQPGSNIFIHGKAMSVGCLAMGDPAIEELFLLAAAARERSIRVVIAPHDPRRSPLDADNPSLPPWTNALYKNISNTFADFRRNAD